MSRQQQVVYVHLNCPSAEKRDREDPIVGPRFSRVGTDWMCCISCGCDAELSKLIPTYPPGDGVFFSYEDVTGHFVELGKTFEAVEEAS